MCILQAKHLIHACNSTPLPHLEYTVLWICKWVPPPLTHLAQSNFTDISNFCTVITLFPEKKKSLGYITISFWF